MDFTRNNDFNIAAIVVLIFVYVFFKIKYLSNSYSGLYYKHLVWCITITAFLNMLSDHFGAGHRTGSTVYLYAIYSVYLIFVELCPFCLAEYSRAMVTNSRKKNIFDHINYILLTIHVILCILTVPFHIYISISDTGMIMPGRLYVLIYLISGYYLIFSAVRMIVHFSRQNNGQVMSVVAFSAVTFFGALLQYFVFGSNIVVYFIYSISSLILLFAFETPDFEKLTEATEELKQSQAELKRAHAREEELSATVHELNKIASWVLYFDEKGQISEANWSQEFPHMLGYDEDDYPGELAMLWSDSLYPDDKEMATQAFMAGLSGRPYDIETRLVCRDGKAKWYRCSGEIKKDAEGKITSFQGFVRDIDDEKVRQLLTDERLKTLEELERSQENLKAALFDAEEANKAKTMFLSNMSHDIRTPMNAIVGFTQLAQEHIDDKNEVIDCLGTIRSSGEHLLALINDVLDMSRIESGKIKVEETACDLFKMMEDLEKMTLANVEAKNQKYESDVSGVKDRFVMCDRLRINQILINCVGNAVKYTPECGRIEVKLAEGETGDDGRREYTFSIRDNGIGMSSDFLKRIFEPFERDSQVRVGQIQGTGLGMAITKNLVEMMDGRISVESELNKGSVFYVTIPLKIIAEDDFKDDTKEAEPGVSQEDMTEALKGSRYLVVDDTMVNRRIVRRLLESRGMIVEECSGGKEAVERLQNAADGDFDMVFMDIQMPGMDGYEACDLIRRSDREYLKKVSIIAMTANAFEEDKQRAREHGMNGHVTKPFRIEELIRVLYDNLKKQ